MKQNALNQKVAIWFHVVLCLVLATVAVAEYAGGISEKYLAIAAGIGIIALLMTGDLKRLWNWPSLLLIGYVAFSMLTALWAMSGKFFLQRYANIFVAAFFFLLVVLWKNHDKRFARHVMEILAGICTFYAFVSIEGVTTGLLAGFSYPDGTTSSMTSRLYGVFHNANIDASFFALGIIFSIALICDANDKRERGFWAAATVLDAVALMLGLSIGALACFAAAIVVYFIFSGAGRGSALVRMLECAVPAAICAVISFECFRIGKETLVLLLTAVAATTAVVFELSYGERLSGELDTHDRLLKRVLVGIVAAIVLYAVLAFHLSTPYTFGGSLGRFLALKPGEHTLQIVADGEVSVYLDSRSRENIMRGDVESVENNFADEGTDIQTDGKTFIVPQDSVIVRFVFSGEEGTTIQSVKVDGKQRIILTYALLPTAIAERLRRGLTANDSFVSRTVLAEDGLKLFRLSPIYGNGVGSFETGITRVQSYPFTTRYVHEHYVQILLEDGIIGFAFFVGALIAMFIALWRKCRQQRDSELFWLYPALFAEMVMGSLQMLWDVSMSIMAFLCCTYAFYGLIVATCAEPIHGKERTDLSQTTEGDENATAISEESAFPIRVIAGFLPIIFVLSICGNLYSAHLVKQNFSSYEEAYGTMERAVKFDLYERNDIMLTYVMMSLEDESPDSPVAQANVYANQLSKVQSNRIPYYLVGYYFNTMQYSRAIEEAMLGATYSASDREQWNNIISLLKQGFVDSGLQSPLLTRDNGKELVGLLKDYYDMREAYNATAVVPLRLSQESNSFFDVVLALDACGGDADEMRAVLTRTGQEEQAG